MKAKLGREGLDLNPHHFGPNFAYREMPRGLLCYFMKGGLVRVFTIPWRSIRASLKRYDAAKVRKAAK